MWKASTCAARQAAVVRCCRRPSPGCEGRAGTGDGASSFVLMRLSLSQGSGLREPLRWLCSWAPMRRFTLDSSRHWSPATRSPSAGPSDCRVWSRSPTIVLVSTRQDLSFPTYGCAARRARLKRVATCTSAARVITGCAWARMRRSAPHSRGRRRLHASSRGSLLQRGFPLMSERRTPAPHAWAWQRCCSRVTTRWTTLACTRRGVDEMQARGCSRSRGFGLWSTRLSERGSPRVLRWSQQPSACCAAARQLASANSAGHR